MKKFNCELDTRDHFESIHADFVEFAASHVAFWRRGTLVLAYAAGRVLSVQEGDE